MKFLLFALIISAFDTQGQNINMDSLNKIVKEGICRSESEKCKEAQIAYIKSCEKIGDYYYELKKYNTALKYYLLVAELGVYTDGELQDNDVIKLRNLISMKAGSMYLTGAGVRRDKKKAFMLFYKTPTFLSNAEKLKYSNLLFKSKRRFIAIPFNNSKTDSSVCFGINPFFLNDSLTAFELSNAIFKSQQKKMRYNKSIEYEIQLTFGDLNINVVNQGDLFRLLDNLKKYLENKMPNSISINVNHVASGYNYQSIVLPKLYVKAR